jgi:hypothetical protein
MDPLTPRSLNLQDGSLGRVAISKYYFELTIPEFMQLIILNQTKNSDP